LDQVAVLEFTFKTINKHDLAETESITRAAIEVQMSDLTHFDEEGASRMVDVGDKAVTSRTAIAESFVTMLPETQKLILDRQISKGDVLEIARIAGIMATKKTADLIPLCHPLSLNSVRLDFEPLNETTIRIESTVKVDGKTGVEMEALTAVSVAALTIYDMCKAVDRAMSLGPTRLVEKSGGKSHYIRTAD
jgi:cyclic pyranopterin monophosphate synthase